MAFLSVWEISDSNTILVRAQMNKCSNEDPLCIDASISHNKDFQVWIKIEITQKKNGTIPLFWN